MNEIEKIEKALKQAVDIIDRLKVPDDIKATAVQEVFRAIYYGAAEPSQKGPRPFSRTKARAKKRGKKRGKGTPVTSLLDSLLAEEFFKDKRRDNKEIITGLAKKAAHVEYSDLTKPLQKFVKDGRLDREKELRGGKREIWVYFEPEGK